MTDLDHVDPSWAVQREQAEMLATSTIIPAAYQGKPSDIITAALYGREIGSGAGYRAVPHQHHPGQGDPVS